MKKASGLVESDDVDANVEEVEEDDDEEEDDDDADAGEERHVPRKREAMVVGMGNRWNAT